VTGAVSATLRSAPKRRIGGTRNDASRRTRGPHRVGDRRRAGEHRTSRPNLCRWSTATRTSRHVGVSDTRRFAIASTRRSAGSGGARVPAYAGGLSVGLSATKGSGKSDRDPSPSSASHRILSARADRGGFGVKALQGSPLCCRPRPQAARPSSTQVAREPSSMRPSSPRNPVSLPRSAATRALCWGLLRAASAPPSMASVS